MSTLRFNELCELVKDFRQEYRKNPIGFVMGPYAHNIIKAHIENRHHVYNNMGTYDFINGVPMYIDHHMHGNNVEVYYDKTELRYRLALIELKKCTNVLKHVKKGT